jgi:hypothetical protein
VFTEKILLYAGNLFFFINSPLVLFTFGKIYLLIKQSAGNFRCNKKATAIIKYTYNKYTDLPKICEHVIKSTEDLNQEDLGYFLAGLIEGDG